MNKFRNLTRMEFLRLNKGIKVYVNISGEYLPAVVKNKPFYNSDADESHMEVETNYGWCDQCSLYCLDDSDLEENEATDVKPYVLVNEFVKKVLNTDESFTLMEFDENERPIKWLNFVQQKVNFAKYIYGFYTYRKSESETTLEKDWTLVAIVRYQDVYLYSDYVLNTWKSDTNELPEHLYRYEMYVASVKDKIRTKVFPDFLDTLPVKEIIDEKYLHELKNEARYAFCCGKDDLPSYLYSENDIVTEQDVANSLVGTCDIYEFSRQRFASNSEKYEKMVAKRTALCNLLKDPASLFTKEEMKMVDGLKSISGKMLTVTFSRNGNSATAKISRYNVLEKLAHNTDFSSYSFATYVSGEKLMEILYPGGRVCSSNLKCDDITTIMFGKKIIYSREGDL